MVRYGVVLIALFSFLFCTCPEPVRADSSSLFSVAVPPDLLIILDLSGSMADNPNDGSATPKSACVTTPGSKCSKVDIAKAAIFKVLNDNSSDAKITAADMTSLNIRIGYMRYQGHPCEEASGVYDYTKGCNKLIYAISNGETNGTTYSKIYCGKDTSCSSNTDQYANNGSTFVVGSQATGGTPLAASLAEALMYLNDNKAADTLASACRKKFVLLITDGEDTYACSGDGTSGSKQRRASVVARAKAIYDANPDLPYQVFVIGFGAGANVADLSNTLNWAAYYGGTENEKATKSGTISAYKPPAIADACASNVADPGAVALSGYAYIATSVDELKAGLADAFSKVKSGAYSFSQPYVSAYRTDTENYIYQASFEPRISPSDPLWYGHVKQFGLSLTDGSVGTSNWDAGLKLQNVTGRTIKTYYNGAVANLSTVPYTALAVDNEASRTVILNFFSGSGNPDKWNLGDVYNSNLAILGTPSSTFYDILDKNNAFTTYRTAHERTTSAGTRIILAGANDGQLHAFKTLLGTEAWSFMPPNSLPNLYKIAHSSDPSTQSHTFFVDGPITTGDAWLCSGSCDYQHKSNLDWKSLIIFGLGKGNSTHLWSNMVKCDGASGFSQTYDATNYPYYCGYYALNAENPSVGIDSLRWTIGTDSSMAYMGEPWSRMSTGRVRIGSGTGYTEKWVGFIGGGYNANVCTADDCDTRGKGVFAIDLNDGSVIKSFTGMTYSFPAAPVAVDTDFDGFNDRVYIGDLGGNIWRMKLCAKRDASSCEAGSWTMTKFFDGEGSAAPIYTKPSVAKDSSGNIWVYWGTGNAQKPTDASLGGRFYGVKDGGGTYTSGSLLAVSVGSSSLYDGSTQGWAVTLSGTGEKVLGDSSVADGYVYFTTFTPVGTDLCSQAGTSKLYQVGFVSGGTTVTTLSGTGIASSPVVSQGPEGTSIYCAISGAGTESGSITKVGKTTEGAKKATIRYWRDLRIQ